MANVWYETLQKKDSKRFIFIVRTLEVHKILDHSGFWPKVSMVFDDFKFKISEGYKQNWSFPVSALLAVSAKLSTGQRQENFNFACNLLKF